MTLPPIAARLRAKLGNEAFGALLGMISGERPAIQIVRYLNKYYGADLRLWHVTIWRAVLTAPSRKLMPGLEVLVRQPLKLIYSRQERESA